MTKPSLQINIQNLRITGVDTGSAVAIGNNYFLEWQTFSKTNSGFGRFNGDRNDLKELNLKVDDPDYQDMFSNELLSEQDLRELLELRGNGGNV